MIACSRGESQNGTGLHRSWQKAAGRHHKTVEAAYQWLGRDGKQAPNTCLQRARQFRPDQVPNPHPFRALRHQIYRVWTLRGRQVYRHRLNDPDFQFIVTAKSERSIFMRGSPKGETLFAKPRYGKWRGASLVPHHQPSRGALLQEVGVYGGKNSCYRSNSFHLVLLPNSRKATSSSW